MGLAQVHSHTAEGIMTIGRIILILVALIVLLIFCASTGPEGAAALVKDIGSWMKQFIDAL